MMRYVLSLNFFGMGRDGALSAPDWAGSYFALGVKQTWRLRSGHVTVLWLICIFRALLTWDDMCSWTYLSLVISV